LAKGFPIPVIFNGQALHRPWALNSGKDFIDTEIGKVHLKGFGPGESWTNTLQELQVPARVADLPHKRALARGF
jgi:hypothetical protein